MARLGWLVALLCLQLSACEKSQQGSAEPSGPPKVIVEEPGAAPSDEGSSNDPALEESGDFGRTRVVVGDVPCQSDVDCVPSECCHPTACVAASAKPDCSATACTMDCRGGTMDCYGGCLCVEGKCAAKLWDPPAE